MSPDPDPPPAHSPLLLLSPIDGRYAEAAAPLREYFSEFALMRARVRVELDYLAALGRAGLTRPLRAAETGWIDELVRGFSLDDAESIRAIEEHTRHDVKAVEYHLRGRMEQSTLKDLVPWLHFGLTSEDVNNLSLALALRDSRQAVLLPALDDLLGLILDFVRRTRSMPMLARTHGQAAVPTTLGKEFAVFLARLQRARGDLASHRFEAKLTGAVGNLNALRAAAPAVDWPAFGSAFVRAFDLVPNPITTQILPYDNWIRYFDLLRSVNAVLIDFAQDVWRYISDGILRQAVLEGEVGSSTMPHKVNPIDFENAEGNLGLANALLMHYAQRLPVSRLQRDLSDSTVRRTFGMTLGHSLLAWVNMTRGMGRIAPDEERARAGLNAHWEVLAEAAQTILRAAGRDDAYEALLRGSRGLAWNEADFRAWVEDLEVEPEIRARLASLRPESYLGFAERFCDEVTGRSPRGPDADRGD